MRRRCSKLIHKSPTVNVQVEVRLTIKMAQFLCKQTCMPTFHSYILNLHRNLHTHLHTCTAHIHVPFAISWISHFFNPMQNPNEIWPRKNGLMSKVLCCSHMMHSSALINEDICLKKVCNIHLMFYRCQTFATEGELATKCKYKSKTMWSCLAHLQHLV